MANEEHLALLRQGVDAWNEWRREHPDVRPDLSYAQLAGRDLSEAYLYRADLSRAVLGKADLSRAFLCAAGLYRANLFRARLPEADLREAVLVKTNLVGADLTGCRVYGIAAWDLKLEGAKQENLIVTLTPRGQPEFTVDDLEVAQFIYLFLHNKKLRRVIDTITSKVVLILGSFAEERKAVLDVLRGELRKRNYSPVIFDFEKPRSRNTDETITLLARMARFVVADLTDAKSVLQELRAIVPDVPSVPVQPLILATQQEPGMFDFFRQFPSVLPSYPYPDLAGLLNVLTERVIDPAETKARELRPGQRT